METPQSVWQFFCKACVRTWKYGYFAPLIALVAACARPGSYVWHVRALYRLTFGKKR
jgi:hypothetical protein